MIGTILIAILTGIISNVLANLSGWKQGLLAMFICVLIFFIQLHRIKVVFIWIWYRSKNIGRNCLSWLSFSRRAVSGLRGSSTTSPHQTPITTRF
jgi:hypothetical protein